MRHYVKGHSTSGNYRLLFNRAYLTWLQMHHGIWEAYILIWMHPPWRHRKRIQEAGGTRSLLNCRGLRSRQHRYYLQQRFPPQFTPGREINETITEAHFLNRADKMKRRTIDYFVFWLSAQTGKLTAIKVQGLGDNVKKRNDEVMWT